MEENTAIMFSLGRQEAQVRAEGQQKSLEKDGLGVTKIPGWGPGSVKGFPPVWFLASHNRIETKFQHWEQDLMTGGEVQICNIKRSSSLNMFHYVDSKTE